LRIDARHHMPDGAILAGRIHRLENQQHRIFVGGIKTLLQPVQPLDMIAQHLLVIILGLVNRLDPGGPLAQMHAFSFSHAEIIRMDFHAFVSLIKTDRWDWRPSAWRVLPGALPAPWSSARLPRFSGRLLPHPHWRAFHPAKSANLPAPERPAYGRWEAWQAAGWPGPSPAHRQTAVWAAPQCHNAARQ